MKKQQRGWIVAGVVVVVVIGAVMLFLSIRSQRSSNSKTTYQTTSVQQGTLTSTVEGNGTVASLLSADLNWSAGGQVDKVNVKIGDQVKDGDILATLLQDSTQSSLESALITAQENLDSLTSPEAVANAKLAVTTDQTNLINAQSAVNNLQYWKNEPLIQDYYASYVIAKSNLDKAQSNYDNGHVGQYINNADEASLYQALYNAQQAYNTAFYYYSLYSQAPTQRQVNEAQANLDLANATLTNDQNYVAALTGGSVSADAAGANLLKLNQAKLAVLTAQENLAALAITAPFAGTITQLDVMPNAVVSTGTQAFRIDDLNKLVVDVQVVEVDINHIQVGQSATLTFDAVPNKTYTGKVIKADLAGTSSQNSTNFVVTVELTDADALVKPGMSANVTVTTAKVVNALLVPSTSVFTDSNGNPYVYLVQSDGSTVQVPIKVGTASDTETQITGGNLKAGDTIVLSFASSSSTGGLGGGGFGFRLGGGGGGTTTNQVVTKGSQPQTVTNP